MSGDVKDRLCIPGIIRPSMLHITYVSSEKNKESIWSNDSFIRWPAFRVRAHVTALWTPHQLALTVLAYESQHEGAVLTVGALMRADEGHACRG